MNPLIMLIRSSDLLGRILFLNTQNYIVSYCHFPYCFPHLDCSPCAFIHQQASSKLILHSFFKVKFICHLHVALTHGKTKLRSPLCLLWQLHLPNCIKTICLYVYLPIYTVNFLGGSYHMSLMCIHLCIPSTIMSVHMINT